MTFRKIAVALTLISLTWLAIACDTSGLTNPYPVDSLFQNFYTDLGGFESLGPAISPIFVQNSIEYQYTVAALMQHDAKSPANRQFHLAPLGLDMGIAEPAIPTPNQAGIRYLNGHVIDADFVAAYDKLGGSAVVGLPITEAHYNLDEKRIEQYFENLGFYRLDSDPPGTVRLLAFGAWKCSESCQQVPLGSGKVVLPKPVDKLFANAVKRLGPDLTGFAIADPTKTSDGFTVQIFGNVVLVADPNNSARVSLSPITEKLGITPTPLTSASKDPNTEFYPVQDGLGYNILKSFLNYIALHGGQEVSGSPIGEITTLKDGSRRQCFQNLCLDEIRTSSGETRIRPVPLGYRYKNLPPSAEKPTATPKAELPQPTADIKPTPHATAETSSEISMQVWESYQKVAPNQNQEIGASILENNIPLSGVEPDLILTLPDGTTRTYYMPPTGEDGQTRIQLDPINAPNGTLIPYKVCLFNLESGSFCVENSFLIWEDQG